MLAQDFLVVMRAVLSTAIGMVDAALRWPLQRNRHVQCPDRQIAFHPVADGPTNDARGMQVEDDSQIEPTLLYSDITYVACLFLVGAVCMEVPVHQVRRDFEAMVAIRGRLKLLFLFNIRLFCRIKRSMGR